MQARTKGFLKNMETLEIKNFIFNPTSFSDEVAINYSEIGSGGGAGKKYQFIGAENLNNNLDIFLRSADPTKIEEFATFLDGFKPSGRFKSPPTMLLVYGSYIKNCMVLSIKRDWVDFNEYLRVTEMHVNLSLKEVF